VSILNLLAWTSELTLYSSVRLYPLPQREPLIIIMQVEHHVEHGIVHLYRASVWEVVLQLKLSIGCTIIQLRWFHARVQIPQSRVPGIELWINASDLNIIPGTVNIARGTYAVRE